MKRIVVDANVFVSIILGGSLSETLYKELQEGQFKLVSTKKMLDELKDVLSRPKFAFDSQHSHNILNFLKANAEFVEPAGNLTICRDPKDNMVLECAAAGKADFIVTGDKDLLVLKECSGVPIITPQAFLKQLNRL